MTETLADALLAASRVFSSLPDDAALRTVAESIATLAPAGAIWVDTSTVSPEASHEAATRCAGRGIASVRAPVSGNNTMAERAALTVFASGDRAAFEAVEPLLACWGPSASTSARKSRRVSPSWR